MELYNKKTNHELLKEIHDCNKKHENIKLEIVETIDKNTQLVQELIEVEKLYEKLVEILQNRM